jgi:ATP-dependent HslUV protease ATP-binding subunit HslU
MFQNMGSGRKKSRKLKISEARKLLIEEEAGLLCLANLPPNHNQ